MKLCIPENPFFKKNFFFTEKSLQLIYNQRLVTQPSYTEDVFHYRAILYAIVSPHKQPEFKLNSSFHNHNGCVTQHRSLSHTKKKHNYHNKTQRSSIGADHSAEQREN